MATTDERIERAAQSIVRRVGKKARAYASSPARGEFRGFAALHDLMDANTLLPAWSIRQTANGPDFTTANKITDRVTQILVAL